MIFVLVIIILLILVGIVIYVSSQDKDYTELDLSIWQTQWREIEKLVNSSDEFAWRQAVINADNLFDKLLKHKGVGGSSLGERLKIIQSRYPGLRQVWPAHLLRNRLVHESSYVLKQSEAKQAIKKFSQGFKNLGLNLE